MSTRPDGDHWDAEGVRRDNLRSYRLTPAPHPTRHSQADQGVPSPVVANWFVIFIAVIVAVFTLYIGIAMCATLRASDTAQRKIRYKVFRDLLRFFKDWWRR